MYAVKSKVQELSRVPWNYWIYIPFDEISIVSFTANIIINFFIPVGTAMVFQFVWASGPLARMPLGAIINAPLIENRQGPFSVSSHKAVAS